MTGIIDIKSLEFDVSNKCGNTCQGCYHNKVITEFSTSPEGFLEYIEKFFSINKKNKIESFALYGGNILENTNCISYLKSLKKFEANIDSYVFSTTFGEYNAIAQGNQKYLFERFFSDKTFIFQYFFNPEFVDEYIKSCRDVLSYKYETHIFFSVQLVEVEKEYITQLIKNLRKFFIAIGCVNKEDLVNIEKNILVAIQEKNRTENFEIQIGTYTFLIMVLHPVRKEKGKITSVCGDSCSFFSSSFISPDNIYNSSMLSVEYDGNVNFHNPNCIASLQKVFHILDTPEVIEEKLKKFYRFLQKNIGESSTLIESCNTCLKYNISRKNNF